MSITTEQGKAIMRMALELETTGRLSSLSIDKERREYTLKNRNVECALQDYINDLIEGIDPDGNKP